MRGTLFFPICKVGRKSGGYTLFPHHRGRKSSKSESLSLPLLGRPEGIPSQHSFTKRTVLMSWSTNTVSKENVFITSHQVGVKPG